MSVLRHRDFRFLWLATTTSTIGDRIVTVALALFVIRSTGSATDLGFVLAAQAVPLVAFLLLGGVWADRLPRHRVMVATDLVRFALHALLAALIVAGSVRIWQVVAIEVAFGTAEAFFRPAATGLLPQTVPEEAIQPANALTGMSRNTAEFVGPALATALVLGLGAGAAFGLDAATFLVSAACLMRIRPRVRGAGPEPSAARVAAGVRAELREGFREVRSRAWVWATLASFCVVVFASFAPWYVLGPVVAEHEYGRVAIYGVLSAAFGVGTIAGSVAGIAWRPRRPLRAAMLWALACPACEVLFALAPPLGVVAPGMVIGGLGIALFDVWWLTALAERIPPAQLSRVSSYDWTVSLALVPAGYLIAGPLGAAVGAAHVVLWGSVLAFLALLLGLLPRETRTLARLNRAAGGTAPVPGPRSAAGG